MKLRQLETFVAVVRSGSFRGAAGALFLTQPAVTQQLQALEREVGFRLVERGARGARLTPEGSRLFEQAQAVLGAIRDFDELARQIALGQAGRVDLGATLTAAEWLVPRLVAAFRAHAPDVEATVKVLHPRSMLQAFAEHTIQVAVLERVPPGFVALPLRRHSLVAVVGAGHVGDAPPPTLLLREPGSDLRDTVEEWLAASGVTFASTMEFASNSALREGAVAGLGCTVLSTDAVGFDVAAGMVQVLDLPGLPIHRTWHLVHQERRPLSPGAGAFVEFCRSPAGTEAIYS